MTRAEWNSEYVRLIMREAHISVEMAEEMAENSDDYFNDGETPQYAVSEELSYWGEE